jgi:hypothetical protein
VAPVLFSTGALTRTRAYLGRQSVPYRVIWLLTQPSGLYTAETQLESASSPCTGLPTRISPQLVVSPPPILMSLSTAPSSSFQSIFDAALDSYVRQTGVDLTKHPSADKLQNCHSPEDFIQLLLERETAFKDHRDKYRKLIDRLRPVVQVVHTFSGVLREAAGFVRSRHSIAVICSFTRPHFRCHLSQPK